MVNIHLSQKLRVKNGINRRWQRNVLLFGGVCLELIYFFISLIWVSDFWHITKNIIKNQNWKVKGWSEEGNSQMGHLSSMHKGSYYISRSEIPCIQCWIWKYIFLKRKNNNTNIPLENTNKGILWMFEYNIYTVT